jgi:cytochrome c-type biogenesis protein CcmH/NrfG
VAVVAAFHDMTTLHVVLWWWAVALGLLESAGRAPRMPEPQAFGWGVGQRAVQAMVLAFLVLWGIAQPAWAWWLWQSEPPSEELVDAAVAAEPWFDRPLEWRVRRLLDEGAWSWVQGAEALRRSERAVRVHPGASRLWLLLGQVNARIISGLGPWPDSVEEARVAFARASELEPHLPWAWLEWARVERGLGHLDRAAELVRRATTEEPNCVRAWLFLARVELDRGQEDQARRALGEVRRAMRLRQRSGLSPYERELLDAPEWQVREIAGAVR